MSDSDSWCTPQYIVDAAVACLETIDLDPCSNARSLIPAERGVCLPDDGLALDWSQARTIWLNPPYSKPAPWLEKLDHTPAESLALIKGDWSTKWWRDSITSAPRRHRCLLSKRVRFLPPPGATSSSPTFPSCIAYRGRRSDRFAAAFEHLGEIV